MVSDNSWETQNINSKCLLVNGKWVGAESGSTFSVSNPMTGSVLGQVPDMRAGDTERAVRAASEAFTSWQNTTAKERWVLKSFYHLDIFI